MLLTLSREGRFNASRSMVPNAHKCGSMNSKVYSYAVSIKATGQRLTREGFILDNALVHQYFVGRFGAKAKKWDAMSCELMTITAAKELYQIIREAGTDCKSVKVELTGSNGATISYTWGEDDAKLA